MTKSSGPASQGSGGALARRRPTVRAGGLLHGATVLGTIARRFSLLVGAAALVVVVLANLDTAYARAVNSPVNEAFEIDAFAGVWLGLGAAAYCQARHSHIDAGISLHRLLPWRATRNVFGVLRTIMVAAFLLLLGWTGWQQFTQVLSSGERTLDTIAWPVWPSVLAVPVGALAWLVVLLTPQPKPEDPS